ncbi:unnamed protein product [Paramecium pentaurelia]|uniref:Uncharacterized protein n=1 Tax=Paramecium pentaurelia TaxID=43138 RepID=A0A8S1X249_9CILI|nr:unnamed protein product [Paramecium pentaurelia]
MIDQQNKEPYLKRSQMQSQQNTILMQHQLKRLIYTFVLSNAVKYLLQV